MERIREDGTLMTGQPVRPTPEGRIFQPLLTLTADVSMSAIAVRRELLEEVGGFDETQHYFEDFDLHLRLSLRSEVAVVHEPLVLIRSHDEHYSAGRVAMLRGREQLLAKMRPHAAQLGLTSVLEQEIARNGVELARVQAAAGTRARALQRLWRHRRQAWHGVAWWRAWAAIATSLAPPSLRSAYRGIRRR